MKKDIIYGTVLTILVSFISVGFIPTKAQVMEIVDGKTAAIVTELKSYMDMRFIEQEKLIREIVKR